MQVTTQYSIRSLHARESFKREIRWQWVPESLDAPECFPMGGHRGIDCDDVRVIHSLGFDRG